MHAFHRQDTDGAGRRPSVTVRRSRAASGSAAGSVQMRYHHTSDLRHCKGFLEVIGGSQLHRFEVMAPLREANFSSNLQIQDTTTVPTFSSYFPRNSSRLAPYTSKAAIALSAAFSELRDPDTCEITSPACKSRPT